MIENQRKLKFSLLLVLALILTTATTVFANSTRDEALAREDFQNIVEIAAANEDFETLVTAVTAAGLADTLSGDGPFTVFAPTDEAFAKLPAETLNGLLADPSGALTDVLLYHVVSGDVSREIAFTLREATTLNGEKVGIKVFENNLYLNDDSKVVIPDVLASNGRIHAIDTVLIPPSMAGADGSVEDTSAPDVDPDSDSIVDIAVGDDRFETLVTALQAAGLVDALSGEGPFTVFAPTDDAFAKLPAATLNSLLADPSGALTDVLLYHVVEGDVSSEIALTLSEATTLGGEIVRVKNFEGDIFLNDDSKVIIADVVGNNGRIHAIDTVLIPPSMADAVATDGEDGDTSAPTSDGTVVDIAIGDDRFETLVTAVTAAGLVDALSAEGPFTVFAPTDDAFAKLPAATLNALLADPNGLLTDVLLYHVVEGDVSKEIAFTLTEATTLGGEVVRVKNFEGDIYLDDDSKVIIPDVIATNGRIHAIDTVLVPASVAAALANGTSAAPSGSSAADTTPPASTSGNTIVDIAVGDDRFETLVTALSAAGLVDTLSGDGPFTVFAPTDDAFAKLPAATLNSLLADPSGALTDVLLYHVVSGDVGSEVAKTLSSATTLNGAEVMIKVFEGDIFLDDDSKVIIPDVVGSNGRIHAIDTVLLPPSLRSDDDSAADTGDSDSQAFIRDGSTIYQIASTDGRFDTLVAALDASGLDAALSGPGPFTVFAPTDLAFALLPAGTLDSLLADPSGALTDVLLYHVVSGDIGADTVQTLSSATTLNGQTISIKVVDGTVYLNDEIQIILTDIIAANGRIHVIDAVLVP